MYSKKKRDYDHAYVIKYDERYITSVSRKCKCGHTVSIFNRNGREICKWCGRLVFIDKKYEFLYKMKRMGVI